MTLTAFRLVRIVTTDSLPPSEWFRDRVTRRFGEDSGWTTLVGCNWCASLYITAPFFLIDAYLWRIPLVVLMIGAAMTVIGFIGNYDD